jgi:hypothetical protein
MKTLLYLCVILLLSSCGVHSREEEQQGLLDLRKEIIILTENGTYLSVHSTSTSFTLDTVPLQAMPREIQQNMVPGSLYSSEYEKIENDNYIVGPSWYWITLIMLIIVCLIIMFG